MITKVRVVFSPLAPKAWNSGPRELIQRCTARKMKTSNPGCVVEVGVHQDGDKGPDVFIDFEDGRKLQWTNASYLPIDHIMHAVWNKKEKIKYFYRQVDKDFEDSDDEDYIGLHNKEKKGAGGKKGGGGGGGKK
jgi:hypothetical protein